MELVSDGLRLEAHLARPSGADLSARPRPGLLLLHGFPDDAQGAESAWATFPELADRLATETSITSEAAKVRRSNDSSGGLSSSPVRRSAARRFGSLIESNGCDIVQNPS